MVAASIIGRDWAGLLRPLDDMQVAPLGWLFVERAAYLFLGQSDYALRLPQLIAGLAALAVFGFAMRNMLGAAGAFVALALFALSPELVRYSAEVKPYGIDVLVAVVMIALSARYFFRQAKLALLDLAMLAAVGVAAIALSLPAAFVLAGFGSALALREALARRWPSLVGLAGVGALWLGFFAWLYLPAIQRDEVGTVGGMQAFWADAFAPFPPTSVDDVKWYVQAVLRLMNYAFGGASIWVAAIACALGAVIAFRRNWLFTLAVLSPAVFALAASMLQIYPFHDRLVLFALPALFVLTGFAADAAADAFHGKKWLATGALAVSLTIGSVLALWGAFTRYPAPFGDEDIRPVLARLAERRSASEAIYVNRAGLPAFRYYAGDVGLANAGVIEGRTVTRGTIGCALADLERISGESRVWIVYAHPEPFLQTPPTEDVVLLFVADAVGVRLDAIERAEVRAYLYAFPDGASEQVGEIRRVLPAREECAT
jgi:hypothetical protein